MKTLLAIIVVAGTAAVVRAQSPQFEVASIRPCQTPNALPGGRQGGSGAIKSSPGKLNAECVTVEDLVRQAYLLYGDGKPQASAMPGGSIPLISRRLLKAPMEGSPAWAKSDKYTIEAETQANEDEALMRGPMLRALLEDRFHLKVRAVTKPIPVYDLTVAAAGVKLEPARAGSCIAWDAARQTRKPAPQDRSAATMPCGMFAPSKRGGVDVNGTTIANLCLDLSAVLDRDVVDKTEITGLFDIHLDVPREQPDGSAPDPAQTFGELKSAVRKLGLKLEAATTSGKFLAIDRIEKPSENRG